MLQLKETDVRILGIYASFVRNGQAYEFELTAEHTGEIKVRPTAEVRRVAKTCQGAEFSLLCDGIGKFVWVGDSPQTYEEATILAEIYLDAILQTAFPVNWNRIVPDAH